MGRVGGLRRVAFVSDIHSNLEALEAVLQKTDDELYCLGDVVGYGGSPDEVIQLLKDRGAVSLRGNHDEAVLTGDTSWFNPTAAIAVGWTMDRISAEGRSYLLSLPTKVEQEFDGVPTYLTHGSPDDNLREYVEPETHSGVFSRYLSALGVRALGLGHTHRPFVWGSERERVFNPGSVGQPRDGDPRASYALASFDAGRVRVEVKRVGYDVDRAASRIVKAGLPESLASRLFRGF